MQTQTAGAQQDAGARFLAWAEKHRTQLGLGAAAVAVLAGSIWFVGEYQQRKGAAASTALQTARTAVRSGNLPLAASDLTRLIGSYRGTGASDEAVILLAQVRLLQAQPDVAAQELQAAIGRGIGDQFRGPAFGLLGSALENVGEWQQAGNAYEDAASASWYAFLSSQYLVDAARAYAIAADTARAISAYERILSEYGESTGSAEARLRLAELQATQASSTASARE